MSRVLLAVVWILGAASFCLAQSTLYYPHVVNGSLGGHVYKTTIFLTNPAANGSGSVTGQIIFLKENSPISAEGTALILTLTSATGEASTGNTFPFELAGGQSLKLVSSGAGSFVAGFAVVLSAAPVAGTATFADFDGSGRLIAEAGVPASAAVPRQTIFIDTVGGYNVGVAYANPDIVSASVRLTLLNSSGVTVATTAQTLGAGNHTAAFTDQLFAPIQLPPLAGTMQITSETPLASIALRYDPTFTIFTTLPPVTIASLLTPAVDWFAHRRPWLNPMTSIARLLNSLAVRLG